MATSYSTGVISTDGPSPRRSGMNSRSRRLASPPCGLVHFHDVIRLVGFRVECHPLCHRRRVFGAEMSVGSGNQHATIGMAEPFGDHLEVDAVLNGITGEEMTEGVVVVARQAQPTTGSLNGLFRGLDGEDGIGGAERSRQLR